jgi:hypothetical protein
MPKSLFAVLLVLVGSVVAFGQNGTEWIKFTAPEKYFSLSLPGEPTLEVITEPLKHNRFTRYEQGYGFVIEYFENMTASDPEKYLDATRDGIAGAIEGTLEKETKITLAGHPGRELLFFIPAKSGVGAASRVRIYYGGEKLYSMSFVWRKDMDPAQATRIGDKYFSSIRITPVK